MIQRNQSFPAKACAFNEIGNFLRSFADAVGMSRDSCHKLTLIVEELFTNTVRHGHLGDSEEPVDIGLSLEPTGVTLTYADTAPRYDSLAAAMQKDVVSAIQKHQIGGLGLVLTFGLAQAAQYAYLDGKNQITIRLPAK
jgi:anti-sigma regulatory factor (Ser/Thr protein kinase)